jgi:hypothetical protein
MAILKINLSGHQNSVLEAEGYLFPGALQIDLNDEATPVKVAEFIANLGVGSGDVVHLALPGLSPLTYMATVILHGLTGSFPFVQVLVRQPDGQYVKGPLIDGQLLRNDVARGALRQDVIKL